MCQISPISKSLADFYADFDTLENHVKTNIIGTAWLLSRMLINGLRKIGHKTVFESFNFLVESCVCVHFTPNGFFSDGALAHGLTIGIENFVAKYQIGSHVFKIQLPVLS